MSSAEDHGMPTVGAIVSEPKLDAELAGLIPPLAEAERTCLESNLLRDGCIAPLIVWDERNILLDGHNRKAVCDQHGISYQMRRISLPSRDAALLWVEEHQLGRRNLTDDQRAAIAYRIQRRRSALVRHARAKAGRAAGGKATPQQAHDRLETNVASKRSAADPTPSRTRTAVARQARVSERKVRNIAELAKASPQVVQQIVDGEVTVKQAQKAVRREQKRQAKAAPPPEIPPDDRFRLICADIAQAAGHVEPASVDWIVTDPPYPKEYLELYDHLASLADHALKPGGSLIAMVGQSYLPEIIAKLSARLTYHWTLAYLTPGGQAVQLWARQVNTFWKPLLWFTKGAYQGDWIGDVCRSDGNDKRFHDWGQSESGMADIVDRLTLPGELILDPFVGAGTTGVVAVRMNRRFVGLDIDAAHLANAAERIRSNLEVKP